MKKLWGAFLFWVLSRGLSEKRVRETLRELSSLCLPPQMPGRVLMPDGYSAEITTTLPYLRIEIGDDSQENGAKVCYWVDRDTMEVLLPGRSVPLYHDAARRVAYVLRWLCVWNPIIPSKHGLVDASNSFSGECVYTQGVASEQTIVGKAEL